MTFSVMTALLEGNLPNSGAQPYLALVLSLQGFFIAPFQLIKGLIHFLQTQHTFSLHGRQDVHHLQPQLAVPGCHTHT